MVRTFRAFCVFSRLYSRDSFGQFSSFYIYSSSHEVGHSHVLLFSNSVVIVQISQIILAASLDVGQEARGSHNCEMIFNILCSFRYFRSYDFISLILGVFMTFLVKLGSCYGIVSIRICLRIFLLGK